MDQINVFHKGIVSDIDKSRVPTDRWVFPTLNMRVIDLEGHGFVGVPLNGTEELFMLTAGYIPLAAVEHKGVLYILSNNGTNTELGSYPSSSGGVWIRQYAPITNIEDNGRQPFRISSLGYNRSSNLDMKARSSYDDTVDLYLCDHVNPNYVINTGLTSEGQYIDRYYTPSQLPKLLKQFLITETHPELPVMQIHNGGQLKFGNYFVYFRYIDRSYNRTPFLETFGPIQIAAGDYAASITGGEAQGRTNKYIKLEFDNLDTSFPYFELAIQRFSGDNSNVLIDEYIIDQQYDINSSERTVIIMGTEQEASILAGDLILRNQSNICKTHTFMDNRYWGANWKGGEYNRDALLEFAKRVKIGYSTAYEWEYDVLVQKHYFGGTLLAGGLENELSTPVLFNSSQANSKQQYKSYPDTMYYTGFFRGEIYPFAIVAEMEDGTFSEAIPVTGWDNYNGATAYPGYTALIDNDGNYLNVSQVPIGSNNKGLYRFPFYNSAYTGAYEQINDMNRPLAAKFDFISAKAYMASYPEYFAGIVGFRIVRGPRVENLLYQGMRLPMCSFNNDNEKEKLMPFDEKAIPISGKTVNALVRNDYTYHGWIVIDKNDDGLQDGAYYFPNLKEGINVNCTTEFKVHDDRFALFSQDHFLETIPSQWKEDGLYVLDLFEYDWHDNTGTAWDDVGVLEPKYYIAPNTTAPDPDVINPGSPWPTNDYHGFYRVYGNGRVLIYDQAVDSFATANAASVEDYDNSGNPFGMSSFADNAFDGRNYFCWDPNKTVDTDIGLYGSTVNLDIGNRTMHTGRYIGLQFLQDKDHDDVLNKRYLSNVYRTKNDSAFYYNNVASLSVASTMYEEISQMIPIADLGDTETCYHGDCFIQRVYRRIMHWHSKSPESIYMYEANDIGEELSDYTIPTRDLIYNTALRYEHGYMIGFKAEGKRNAAMRYAAQTNTYYPYSITHGVSSWAAFVVNGEDDVYIDESNLYNVGYQRVTPYAQHKGYDDTRDMLRMTWPTRIKYGVTNLPFTIADGARIIAQSNYQDYDMAYGPITWLTEILGRLVSVQESAINQHHTDNQGIEIPTSEGEATVGKTEILARQVLQLCSFGSQHLHSCGHSERAAYGWDWNKKILWQISLQSVGFKQQCVVKDLGLEAGIQSEIKAFVESYDPYSDVLGRLPDSRYTGLGLSLGVDYANSEIYFTALWFGDDPEYGFLDRGKTFVYSEKIQAFNGNASFTPMLYSRLGVDMISFGYFHNSHHPDYKGYHHRGAYYSRFYGKQFPFVFSVLVNGNSEQQNTSLLTKVFNAWKAEMPEHELKQAIYDTEYQHSEQALQGITNFWEEVIHSEHRWNVPIAVNDGGQNHEFGQYSELRGRWLRLTVEYESPVFTFVKNIVTNFNISYR